MLTNMLTTAEAAAILGIAATSVPRTLREHGVEPHGREPPGRGFLWPKTAVLEVAAAATTVADGRGELTSNGMRRSFPPRNPGRD